MNKRLGLLSGAIVLVLGAGFAYTHLREPGADRQYDTHVAQPQLAALRPRILFDHGHRNSHAIDGRYAPFAALIRADGCRVRQTSRHFDAKQLAGTDVLVIVNARGPESDATQPAFSEAECDAVREYVDRGGALLLVADHHPCGEATAVLAQRFGVEMSGGWTDDSTKARAGSGDPGQLLFTAADGTLGDHPIVRGAPGATIDTVETFTGQSLSCPPGAQALLRLSSASMDRIPVSSSVAAQGSKRITTFQTTDRPAAGRVQGLAMPFGRGRVVVLGEAAMLTAQRSERGTRFGMNAPGNDNRAFTLNVIRWLAGGLDGAGSGPP